MTDLATHLERLGLELYLDAFVAEGFDSWEILLDIQESDLDALGVKLGHRRKLQRAIADHRGISYERPLDPKPTEAYSGEIQVGDGQPSEALANNAAGAAAPQEKRKYRRHPKQDENAPEKPPSAYVLFSNKTREDVKAENLSFTEIAKLVGERWQKLEPSEKEPYESHAQTLKDSYHIQLSAYKKTDSYRNYMQYLAEFKLKHGQPSDNKRPKLDPQSSGGSLSATSTLSDPITPGATQGRGGSLEAVSEIPRSGVEPSLKSPAELTPTSSMPYASAVSSGGFAMSSDPRTRSPSSTQYDQDLRRVGQISTKSSTPDETAQLRSESSDPLSRTATLSLNTPPPASNTPKNVRLEQSGGLESFTWPSSRHSQPNTPLAASHGSSGLAYTPPLAESWRDRRLDPHRQSQPSVVGQGGYPPPLTLAPIIAPGRLPDLTRAQTQRILPPLQRQYPTGSSPHPPYTPQHLVPAQSQSSSRSPRSTEYHDNEAAAALTTLAKRSVDEPMPPYSEARR